MIVPGERAHAWARRLLLVTVALVAGGVLLVAVLLPACERAGGGGVGGRGARVEEQSVAVPRLQSRPGLGREPVFDTKDCLIAATHLSDDQITAVCWHRDGRLLVLRLVRERGT